MLGNDTITGGSNATNLIFGDAETLMGNASIGGNDTLVGAECDLHHIFSKFAGALGNLGVPHEDLAARGIGRVGELVSARGGRSRKRDLHSAEVTAKSPGEGARPGPVRRDG
jgi:hypothetical protein